MPLRESESPSEKFAMFGILLSPDNFAAAVVFPTLLSFTRKTNICPDT